MNNSGKSAKALSEKVYEFITKAPPSSLPKSENPDEEALKIIKIASFKAAAVSGVLALPPGPLGVMTILPDLVAIWKIQSQMVADIAALYGKQRFLTKEVMMYCLFKEGSQEFLRDVIMRVGDRYVLRKTSLNFINKISGHIGSWLTKKLLGRNLSRWIPFVGAAAMGYYTKKDTEGVGHIALSLFSYSISTDDETIIDVNGID